MADDGLRARQRHANDRDVLNGPADDVLALARAGRTGVVVDSGGSVGLILEGADVLP